MTNSREKIITQATSIFALYGYEGLSMRALAKKSGITQSVLYHYFDSKTSLLDYMFDSINANLGNKRKQIKKLQTASALLRQRIEFQLDNAKDIAAILKYYLSFREKFQKNSYGFVPDKTSQHMVEVLKLGKLTGEFKVYNLSEQAKVMTHAVNGYILEYFPYKLIGAEKDKLINSIHKFLLSALKSK